MAGDIRIRERAVILPEARAQVPTASLEMSAKRRRVHIRN